MFNKIFSHDSIYSRQYRPDIDALRALAVFAVILYHAFPYIFRGGFIGVDMFFVISGYLITSILLSKSTDHISTFLADFYSRRIRRIYPALIFVLASTFLTGGVLLAADSFALLSKNIVAATFFASNIFSYSEIGYFDIAAEDKPLLHLWSLGVEEQFYILWPLAVFFLKEKKSLFPKVIALTSVVSLGVSIYLSNHFPQAAFFMPFTRFWEFLAGGILSLPTVTAYNRSLWATHNKISLVGKWLQYVALALFFVAFLKMPKKNYPGALALLPVLLTSFLIASYQLDTLVGKVLRLPILSYIGRISFPLYLWHYPLLSFLHITANDAPSVFLKGLFIGLAIVLAALTYYGIEKPLRFGGASLRVWMLQLSMLSLAFIGTAGIYKSNIFLAVPQKVLDFAPKDLQQDTVSHWRKHICFLDDGDDFSHFSSACLGESKHSKQLLVWGDSSAASLVPGLIPLANKHGYDLAQYTASACPPLIGMVQRDQPNCKAINDHVLQIIKKVNPDIIFLQAYWTYPNKIEEMRLGIQKTVETLKILGIHRVVLVGPDIIWNSFPAQLAVDYWHSHLLEEDSFLPERTFYHANVRDKLDNELKQIAVKNGAEYISFLGEFCNASGCLTQIDEQPLFCDHHHLSMKGAEYMASKIEARVFP